MSVEQIPPATTPVTGTVTEATLDAALIAQEATTSGIKGLTSFGAVTTGAPTYTTAKSDALSLQTDGSLRVANTAALPAGSAVIGHVITDSGSVAAVTQTTSPWVSNTTQLGSNNITTNTGVVGAGVQRVVLATDVQLPKSNELPAWAASSNLTVTNLNSLAASATYVAGWQSAVQDFSSGIADARITVKLTGTSSNNQAGTAFLYLVGMLDDSNWPAGAGGGEGTLTPTGGASIIGAIFRLGAVTTIDNSAGRIYYLDVPSVKAVWNGTLPKKVVIYITGNGATSTNAQFASSGNQVTVVTSYITLGA